MYNYEDVLQTTKKYFNHDEFPSKVCVDKYLLRNENNEFVEQSPDEIHRRIASEIARIEKNKFKNPYTEEFIYDCIKNFGFIIPQGSPILGIGNKYQYVTLSNCYVLDSPLDSYAGILHTDQQLVNVSKRRGGVGLDLSYLRPEGVATHNASRSSSGILSWMERYSNSIREVGQYGRRGALMLTLSVHHPQVLDFAKAKLNKTKVTGANISVRLTDEFLTAVEKDEVYEQRWPVDSAALHKISQKINARHVWRELISCAHAVAEPGLIFWDRIISESPADCYSKHGFDTQSTNPCQPGWAKILTKCGIRTIEEVYVGDEIWSEQGWTRIVNKVCTGIKKVFRYGTTAGCFYGTEKHEVISFGEKIEACTANSIDTIVGPYSLEIEHDEQYIMDGLVLGDGSVHKASNNLIHLNVGKNDYDYFNSEIAHLITKHRPGIHDYAYEVKTNILSEELVKTYDRKIPERYVFGTRSQVASFLRGLFSANGSMSGDRVTLKASSFKVIEDAQLMLSSLGIRSYYTTNKTKSIKFKNGEYVSKQSYDLNITSDRVKFHTIIGFIQNYKTDKLQHYIKNIDKPDKGVKRTYDIVSIDFISEEQVYDITVDNSTHTYWTQGCNVSNCGEIPLCSLDSCRLLLLNLFKFVVNPFADAYFNYAKFYQYAQIAQRFMDDIIDLEIESIDRIINKIDNDPEPYEIKRQELELWQKIRYKCLQGRRTGIGITALGDCLAGLGIKYGSEDSINVVDKIYKTLKFGCYRSSVDMAKELGPFPIWNANVEEDNPFLNRIKDEILDLSNPNLLDEIPTPFVYGFELYDDMCKHGRRNIALLTTAPAGTVSIVAEVKHPLHGTSSGIEPVFQLSYKRRKKINPSDKNVRVDFVDQNGDSWQEFEIYHPAVKLWMEITGKSDLSDSPWAGATAEEINWENRVKLQATAQRHVDHSISSTINLPEDISVDEVVKIYETAWKAGCKGITVYRKNCRTGVLVDKTSQDEVNKINRVDAPKRPKDLNAHVYGVNSRGQEYFVIISTYGDNSPYEVFAGKNLYEDKADDIEDSVAVAVVKRRVSKKVHNGIVRKLSRGIYQLIDEHGKVILDDITELLDSEQESITRLVSTSLRHGVPIEFLVSQLTKVSGEMTGFAKCIARVLKHYVKDGTKATGQACPECKSENLKFQDGCVLCVQCNWSRCS